MNTNRRFTLDKQRCVIVDALNPVNSRRSRLYLSSEEDRYLREEVLLGRLGEMIDTLIPSSPERLPSSEADESGHPDTDFISNTMRLQIFDVIQPSHLNVFDPMLAFEHQFDGALKRPKKGMQDLTSLSLFCDDVERLLRDLYGDFESEALENVLSAIPRTVRKIASCLSLDLWEEDNDTSNIDVIFGIGVPEGYIASGSDHRLAMQSFSELKARVRNILANPSYFSEYSVEFANRFSQHWDCGLDGKCKEHPGKVQDNDGSEQRGS